MYRLLEVTYTNGKESAALYDSFSNETELTAEFDTKMGAAIKADAYKAEYLLAFDDNCNIYAQDYHSKDAEITLNPRLVWVTTTAEGATANQSKEDNMSILKGDFFSKRGSAKRNTDVKAIMLMCFNGKVVDIKDYWARPVEPVEPQEVEE